MVACGQGVEEEGEGGAVNYTIKPIETKYAGVIFRSRLEAKWAAMFDLLEWSWSYEPADFNGWLPDFVIHGNSLVYVEVKPVYEFPEAVASKLDSSGCQEEMMIIGERGPRLSEDYSRPFLGWMTQKLEGREEQQCSWWDEAMLGRFGSNAGQVGFCHATGSYEDRITGIYDGGCFGAGILSIGEVERLWREAGNRVRWEPSA